MTESDVFLTPRAADALLSSLTDPRPAQRRRALYEFLFFRRIELLEPLRNHALVESDPKVAVLAAQVFHALKSSPWDFDLERTISRLLAEPGGTLRLTAPMWDYAGRYGHRPMRMALLGRIPYPPPPETWEFLDRCLGGIDPVVRGAACRSALVTGKPELIAQVIHRLWDDDSWVQQQAFHAWNNLAPSELVRIVDRGVRSDERPVTTALARLLPLICREELRPVLLQAVAHPHAELSDAARKALDRLTLAGALDQGWGGTVPEPSPIDFSRLPSEPPPMGPRQWGGHRRGPGEIDWEALSPDVSELMASIGPPPRAAAHAPPHLAANLVLPSGPASARPPTSTSAPPPAPAPVPAPTPAPAPVPPPPPPPASGTPQPSSVPMGSPVVESARPPSEAKKERVISARAKVKESPIPEKEARDSSQAVSPAVQVGPEASSAVERDEPSAVANAVRETSGPAQVESAPVVRGPDKELEERKQREIMELMQAMKGGGPPAPSAKPVEELAPSDLLDVDFSVVAEESAMPHGLPDVPPEPASSPEPAPARSAPVSVGASPPPVAEPPKPVPASPPQPEVSPPPSPSRPASPAPTPPVTTLPSGSSPASASPTIPSVSLPSPSPSPSPSPAVSEPVTASATVLPKDAFAVEETPQMQMVVSHFPSFLTTPLRDMLRPDRPAHHLERLQETFSGLIGFLNLCFMQTYLFYGQRSAMGDKTVKECLAAHLTGVPGVRFAHHFSMALRSAPPAAGFFHVPPGAPCSGAKPLT
jgi:hypothetical protein